MILCITHSQDFYNIDLFFDYLQSKNIAFFRLNSDDLSHQMKINLTDNSFIITDEAGNKINSKDIKAVWHRKSWNIAIPEDLDENYAAVFLNEYESLRFNLFTALEHLPWINPLQAERKIESNKILQLTLAKKNNLIIPETLFSNDEEAVKEFFHQFCQGKAIAKLHGTISKSMNGQEMISTLLFDEDNLEQLSDIAVCPMIFQPYIEKEYELRIVYLNGEFFTGKINNKVHTDWRISQTEFFWEPYELPKNIEENLSLMMQEMGLVFGAIDMIKSTNGNYYFLEVNPQGEWGMLQKELDFPIAQRIADYLINRIHTNEQ
ncbi:MvdC/MvdD family ATP grasp protein [Chryseobacterium sp. 2R14A]|uniref:MvdC/MvdD family ATP grasp protein n=1 Tax=Chryseobacterium sp. 2R14A TaxID=3380353 RepID=UPI003CECFE12